MLYLFSQGLSEEMQKKILELDKQFDPQKTVIDIENMKLDENPELRLTLDIATYF